jgi:two-component system nitrogen regulation response regulator GlnG
MPRVLVVDDDRAIRQLIGKVFAHTEYDVEGAGHVDEALAIIRAKSPDVVLLDIELPEISGLEAFEQIRALDAKLPVIYITGGGSSNTAIEAMKLGAFDYVLKPLDVTHVRELVDKAAEIRRLMHVPVEIDETVSPLDQGDQIVGRSPAMQEVYKAIGRVAPQNVTVLIRGESGTGKELVARAIYQHSDRRGAPFLAVNCAAIPEQLLESELFGHEKGSFTGADRTRIGKFEQCNGGTIFLDEVGDMPLPLQGKMLRLLQQQQFQRVGGNETIQTDVRIVAATNRDLEQMVADGDFREDFLYRLNGYTILLPPLREREDDLVLLVQHFMARIGREVKRDIQGIAPGTLEILKAYDWPGNIRELEGVLRHAMLQASGTILAPEFLPAALCAKRNRAHAPATNLADDDERLPVNLAAFVRGRLEVGSSNVYAETLEMMERFLLSEVLTRAAGNQSEAARILGITRGTLRHKIRTNGIKIESTVDVGGG